MHPLQIHYRRIKEKSSIEVKIFPEISFFYTADGKKQLLFYRIQTANVCRFKPLTSGIHIKKHSTARQNQVFEKRKKSAVKCGNDKKIADSSGEWAFSA